MPRGGLGCPVGPHDPGWLRGVPEAPRELLVVRGDLGSTPGRRLGTPCFYHDGCAVNGGGPLPPPIYSLMGRSIGINRPSRVSSYRLSTRRPRNHDILTGKPRFSSGSVPSLAARRHNPLGFLPGKDLFTGRVSSWRRKGLPRVSRDGLSPGPSRAGTHLHGRLIWARARSPASADVAG